MIHLQKRAGDCGTRKHGLCSSYSYETLPTMRNALSLFLSSSRRKKGTRVKGARSSGGTVKYFGAVVKAKLRAQASNY